MRKWWRMKLKSRRRRKARVQREMYEARKSQIHELGDHRRWLWLALSPWREECAVFGGGCNVHFDRRWGRLYTPDQIGGRPNPPPPKSDPPSSIST